MELKINQSIKEQTKVSYAIESAGPLPYDIDCGEGINIVMTPPAAQKAFAELKFEMLQPYPHSVAVKDSIIHYWKGYTELNYKRIVLCDGSISGLYLLNRLFLEKDAHVLGYVPQFSEYETDVKMYGCHFDRVTLKKENNYKFSAEDVLDALNDSHRLVYLDNPNNPTGQVIPLAEIEKILKAAAKLGAAVIVDEAYGDYMPKENSATSLCDAYDNLIVVKTFSKGFGLAGLRAGYLLLPEQLVPNIGNITNPYSMSELSRSVAAKTIQDEAFLEELRSKTGALKKQLMTYPLEEHLHCGNRRNRFHLPADPQKSRRRSGSRICQTSDFGHLRQRFLYHRTELCTVPYPLCRGYAQGAGGAEGDRRKGLIQTKGDRLPVLRGSAAFLFPRLSH